MSSLCTTWYTAYKYYGFNAALEIMTFGAAVCPSSGSGVCNCLVDSEFCAKWQSSLCWTHLRELPVTTKNILWTTLLYSDVYCIIVKYMCIFLANIFLGNADIMNLAKNGWMPSELGRETNSTVRSNRQQTVALEGSPTHIHRTGSLPLAEVDFSEDHVKIHS